MRLFVAALLSKEVSSALHDVMDQLAHQSVSIRLTPPENLHLTMAFLGETDDPQRAVRALESLDADSFRLELHGAGRFGDLWWAGIVPDPALMTCAQKLYQVLREEGFFLESRKFQPHITLARKVKTLRPPQIRVRGASMTVRALSLMKSDLTGPRPVYSEIFRKKLGSAAKPVLPDYRNDRT